jgi:hypothetical protein
VDVNLEDFGFVDLAVIIEAEHQIVGLQLVDARLAAWYAHERVAEEAPQAARTSNSLCH